MSPLQHMGTRVPGDEEAASASCGGARVPRAEEAASASCGGAWGGDAAASPVLTPAVRPPGQSHLPSHPSWGRVPPQGAAWPEEDGQHCPGVFMGRQVSQPAVSHRGASRKGAQSHSAARELARCTVRPRLGPSRPRREFAKRAHPKGGGAVGCIIQSHSTFLEQNNLSQIVFNS